MISAFFSLFAYTYRWVFSDAILCFQLLASEVLRTRTSAVREETIATINSGFVLTHRDERTKESDQATLWVEATIEQAGGELVVRRHARWERYSCHALRFRGRWFAALSTVPHRALTS